MSYRCNVCLDVSPPGMARIIWTEYREVHSTRQETAVNSDGVKKMLQVPYTRREISREVAVCKRCMDALDSGITLPDLIVRKRLRRGHNHSGRVLENKHSTIGRILSSFPKP